MAALYLDRSANFDLERAQGCVAKLLKGTPEKCDKCGALTTFAKDTVEKTEIKVETNTPTPYGNVNVKETTSNTDKDLKDLEEDFM